ncbi:secondary thiamine-phosphate synthase enzyme [Afifella marina DSM 2698]|nr:secondary thiamine-phosphate synthase enzyme YjbQ [Afifella marina]MBK1623005.1 secondary thiamine-phosphate synthase enzyme [Afifella marina DSM 2698]MBK1625999.1 secondary thiamine-phosphate synthase enzyme [Afifella marina]MBK5917823.1 secondary thiamine-phosphate synthase enzyme [Afifella marina]RAI18258.1 secondary thiamine-phosphate synthase enzyme [Afifella marina DSM 2698]
MAARLVQSGLSLPTRGQGFIDITAELQEWLREAGARSGLLCVFVRHTSASLTIQENADPSVQTDLLTALDRLAPQNAGWVHDTEGADDMPAHIRTMLTDVSLTVPVEDGRLALGTWQGVYLVEHRTRPHRRSLKLVYFGS